MLTLKEINRGIAGVRKSAKAIRKNVQKLLPSMAGHAYEHGDVTAFTRLYLAMSGADRKAMASWAREYGFAILQKDGTFKLNAAARKAADFESGAAVTSYLEANAPEWWTLGDQASQIAKALDVAARLEGLAKQIERAAEKGDREVTVDAPAINAAVRHLHAALKAAQITDTPAGNVAGQLRAA